MNRVRSWIGTALALGICVGSALSAQSIVVPAGRGVANDLATVEGNSGFHLPSRQAPSRVLTVYRGADLKVGVGGMTIQSVSFRRDGQRATMHRAHRFKTTIHMSSRGVRLPAVVRDDSFDAAHGVDRRMVLDQKLVDWPAATQPKTPPAPFAVRVRLDRPFVLAKGRNLCVDVVSAPEKGTNPENHYWYVDAESFDRSGVLGQSRNLGRGCPFGNQLRVAAPPVDGETSIEAWVWTRSKSPSRTYLAIADASSRWLGRTLPLDLVGAAGCKLYVAPIAVDLAMSGRDARGTARFSIAATPKDARFVGALLHLQTFVEDPGIGPLGIRSSSWVEAKLGKLGDPLPARTLYDSGPSIDDVPTASRDLGLVLELGS